MENDSVRGSIEVLNSLQLTEGLEGLDYASKELYKNKEVLAIILKGATREFEGYSYKEIMGYIEADSITTEENVSPGRIIRLGDKVFREMEDKEKNGMMEFLHAVMYPHKENFLETIKKHINFSDNEALWKEVVHMSGLGMSIREECLEEGRAEGRAEEIIESGYDFGMSKQDILARLQKKLQITLEQAEEYMKVFGKQLV